jgi:hypothetical protein
VGVVRSGQVHMCGGERDRERDRERERERERGGERVSLRGCVRVRVHGCVEMGGQPLVKTDGNSCACACGAVVLTSPIIHPPT